MRVTVDDMEKPEMFRKFQGVKILVDGVEHRGVIVADQERGYIEKHKLDRDGKVCLNMRKTEVLTDKVIGRVDFLFANGGL